MPRFATFLTCFCILFSPPALGHENHLTPAQKTHYIQSALEILNVKTARISKGQFKGHPSITFEIKNSGSETLTLVRVDIQLLDDQGRAIHQQRFTPVLLSEFNFAQSTGLLAAFERFQIPRKHPLVFDAPWPNWSGNVTIKIVEIDGSH